MSRTVRPLAALMLAIAAAGAYGEDRPPQRVLVPVYTADPIPGVNGASWTTDLWISNSGSANATVDGILWDCFLEQCGPASVEPGVTFHTGPEAGGLHGALLYLDPTTSGTVGFSLRFRDLSRQSSTWGTGLPVVREDAFRTSIFSLVDVPVTEGFRQTLRIYELDGTEREASVRVRVFRMDEAHTQPYDDPDSSLGESVIPLHFAAPTPPVTPGEATLLHPGYAEVTDLASLAPLGDAERVRLEIEPVTAGLKLWAFVTVIHNESQHATVVTPQ